MNSAGHQDTRLIYRNLLHFFTLTMKYQKEKVKDNINEYDKNVDIYLQGHYHFGHYIEKDNKHYIFNSCFLKNTDRLFKIIINDVINIKEI